MCINNKLYFYSNDNFFNIIYYVKVYEFICDLFRKYLGY